MTEVQRVLVVEDELLIALDTQEVVTDAGYVVVGPATTVEQAIKLADEGPLSAAILDVNLAGTYVWPVARHLASKGVPFVFLSGFGNGLDVPAALQAAPKLGKPIRPAELGEALQLLMAARDLR